MLDAVSRDTPRADLPALGHEVAQHHDVLVVDVGDPVLTEDADLALLLLPSLLVLFLARAPGPRLRLTRHPVVSPSRRCRRRRRGPRLSRPSPPMSSSR